MDPTTEFVRLWTRHQAEVERYLFMMMPRTTDVGELLQEVSVRLWEKWDQFDQERPFVPWALKFAWFEVQKWRQRLAREKLVFSDGLLEQLNAVHENEVSLMETRRRALEVRRLPILWEGWRIPPKRSQAYPRQRICRFPTAHLAADHAAATLHSRVVEAAERALEPVRHPRAPV